MRCPTTAISDLLDRTLALPDVRASSKCAVAFSRALTVISSFRIIPAEFFTSRLARSPCHSNFPSHNGAGGESGREAPKSNKLDFWLLEPELRTRTFTQ